jgi:hypothetical protein
MSGIIAKYLIFYILTRKNCFSELKSVFDHLKKITSKRPAKKYPNGLVWCFRSGMGRGEFWGEWSASDLPNNQWDSTLR